MDNELQNVKQQQIYGELEKKKAAYALNMCTVSISQIVNYHDSYILEQEYDTIFNNLNLKQIPKDEALLRIISELLNTISYFKISDLKKEQIEKRYQQRMKQAIWSAVPNLNVVVSGHPLTMVMSLVTQIGTGYMNYRKEKANAGNDREDAETELEITAIEQFNALKRELFTTAWRLADEYDFEDEWRLTEKQIKQYNEILMDQDGIRKYIRLEAIADKFQAYPPFWYFFGHTANYIAEMSKKRQKNNSQETEDDYQKDEAIIKAYTEKAKQHFEQYDKLSDYSILREDQLTASFALEYADILINEQPQLNEQQQKKNNEKIGKLLKKAEKNASTSFDILQLCMISYLKVGQTKDAIRLLKFLVNERYNSKLNIRLLSRLYVSRYLKEPQEEAGNVLMEYQLLEDSISDSRDLECMYPMPKTRETSLLLEEKKLQEQYLNKNKLRLELKYRFVLDKFAKKYIVKYNKLWYISENNQERDDSYFYNTKKAETQRDEYIKKFLESQEGQKQFILKVKNIPDDYLELLNNMIISLDELELFRNSNNHDKMIASIRDKMKDAGEIVATVKKDTIYDTYKKFQKEISLPVVTKQFFNEFNNTVYCYFENLNANTPMEYFEKSELELSIFCSNHSLPDPDDMYKKANKKLNAPGDYSYFQKSIFEVENKVDQWKREMMQVVIDKAPALMAGDPDEVAILLPGTKPFEEYFERMMMYGGLGIKFQVLLVIDDKTERDYDLLLTYEGFRVVDQNQVHDQHGYETIYKNIRFGKTELVIGWPNEYTNANINIDELYDLMMKLKAISSTKNKEM